MGETGYCEDDLLPISAVRHLAFCERQCALVHIEQVWRENRFTAEGRVLHERTHRGETESRGPVRIARGVRLRSLRLGLVGVADVVEFHRGEEGTERIPPAPLEEGGLSAPGGRGLGSGGREGADGEQNGAGGGEAGGLVSLPGLAGRWRPFPVEYKRGRPKAGNCDRVQLCAQAMCLEEMLGVAVPEGGLFYGRTRRRLGVRFDPALREETEALCRRLHEFIARGVTPPAANDQRCKFCSLAEVCAPKAATGTRRVAAYVRAAVVGTPAPREEGAGGSGEGGWGGGDPP